MCLAIPMQIVKIEGNFAVALADTLKKRINIEMLPAVKTGDFVIVHAGFAIQKIDQAAARQTLDVINEIRK